MLRFPLVKSAKLLCALMLGGWIVGGGRAIADEVGCYMITSDGRTLDVSHICGAKVQVGAYLSDPEPVPDYTQLPATPYSAPARISAPQAPPTPPPRTVSQELPFLGALPPLPPMEQF